MVTRECTSDLVDDQLTGEGLAKIKSQRIFQEQQILYDERFIQIVFGTNLRSDGLIDRLIAKHRLNRVARQCEHQGVHQKRRAENHRDHLQNASQKISAHWFLLLLLIHCQPFQIITHNHRGRLTIYPASFVATHNKLFYIAVSWESAGKNALVTGIYP